MEKERLYKLLDNVDNKKEAIEMIISNFIDVGTTHLGGCVSVNQFGKIAECLIECSEREEQPTSDKQNDTSSHVIFSLPTKDEVVSKLYARVYNGEYKKRNVMRNNMQDCYYSGYLDCFDKLTSNDR